MSQPWPPPSHANPYWPSGGGVPPLPPTADTFFSDPPPRPPTPWYRKTPVVAVGGLVVGFVIGAAVASPAEPGEQAVTVTSVSPSAAGKVVAAPKRTAQAVKLAALIADFDRNQLSAEKKWGDKSVVVTGVIDNISEDVLGKPYLSFENPSDEITLTSVACYLKNVADAEKLANGETRTVQGVVDEDQSLGVIALNDCVVVK